MEEKSANQNGEAGGEVGEGPASKYRAKYLDGPPRFTATCVYCGKAIVSWRQPVRLCSHKCRRRFKNGAPLVRSRELLAAGLRECTKCHKILSASKFWKAGRYLHSTCPECSKKKQAQYRTIRPPSLTATQRLQERARAKKYRETHPELCKQRVKRWVDSRPGYGSTVQSRRRFRKASNGLFLVTLRDIKRMRDRQRDECYICGRALVGKGHIEHIIPLVRGGRHSVGNIALACPACNHKKSKKFLAEIRYAS